MAVSAGLVGRTFAVPPYDVTSQAVSDFATAIGTPLDDPSVPPTFPIVVAFGAMRALMDDPEVGIELQRVVHGEQRFVYTRPVVLRDLLAATLTVETLRQIGGNDIIGTRCDLVDAHGAHVVTAFATLVHRGDI